jgi:hypothetical protein
MPTKPHDDNDQPANTYFEHARRFPDPGGAKSGGEPLPTPLPPSSPWSASIDEIVGVEPSHDGTADGDFIPTPSTEGDE